jgi:hypothetical protein
VLRDARPTLRARRAPQHEADELLVSLLTSAGCPICRRACQAAVSLSECRHRAWVRESVDPRCWGDRAPHRCDPGARLEYYRPARSHRTATAAARSDPAAPDAHLARTLSDQVATSAAAIAPKPPSRPPQCTRSRRAEVPLSWPPSFCRKTSGRSDRFRGRGARVSPLPLAHAGAAEALAPAWQHLALSGTFVHIFRRRAATNTNLDRPKRAITSSTRSLEEGLCGPSRPWPQEFMFAMPGSRICWIQNLTSTSFLLSSKLRSGQRRCANSAIQMPRGLIASIE